MHRMKFNDEFDGLDTGIRIFASANNDEDDEFDISINDDEDEDEEDVEVLTNSDDDDVSDDADEDSDDLIPHDSHAEEAVLANEPPSTLPEYRPATRLSMQPTRRKTEVSVGAALKGASAGGPAKKAAK